MGLRGFAGAVRRSLIFMLMCGPILASAAESPLPMQPSAFFSQGQALSNLQDRARSRSEAVQDFLRQAVMQAAASLVSPSEMGSQFRLIQERILSQPDRYVKSYQIFSEDSGSGGLYRVAGQVMVNMEPLRADMGKLGLGPTTGERIAEVSREAVETPGPTSSGAEPEESSGEEVKASAEDVAGPEILWVVAEKWDQEWHLPVDRRDPHSLFAGSVLNESADYDWSILLPQSGSLVPDHQGGVPRGPVIDQAKAAGVGHAVLGTVALREGLNQPPRLTASLKLVHVASGKTLGEIHRELDLTDRSNHEGAMELASLVVPDLDKRLVGKGPVPTVTRPEQDRTTAQDVPEPSESGELLLMIPGQDGFEKWSQLEAVLKEQFKNLQVRGLEFGPEGTVVRLVGIGRESLKGFDGKSLPSGVRVRVVDKGSGGHALAVEFDRPHGSP